MVDSPALEGPMNKEALEALVKGGEIIAARTLSKLDLTGIDLSGAVFEKVDLSGSKLDGGKLREAVFVGCDLRGVSLSDKAHDVRVNLVLRPSGRLSRMDGDGKSSCFDFAVDSWLGVFDAPLFEIVPTEGLYWRLIHSLVLVQTTHHCVSQEQMAHSVREK